ncbi:piggyBac transposable element-derived protein 4-like [Schistocerca serialis cubense]|uniref:piggyBac transposable element-derived protein 4-like n=1 Tax=Schistocerca serialis cubense TaxID=2023355 RepID=UPI00214EA092|nr:piggyBac transposable element-derived protein 4-like [Schistocerca serialis cubense]
MSRRGLRDEEIERLLCEIPSDEDSTVDTTDDESDYEASIVAEAIVSSEGEVSESEEESESTPPKRAADTAPTWGQQFNATSGMQFDSESGPSAFIRDIDDPEPIDIFEKIFPKELVQLIVFQTNLYATQSGKSFTPTTDNEIRTFLGINILMGIKRMPAYRDYWSSAPELHDRYIASLMAVNRFGWLLRNIHLNDNTLHPEKGHPGYDKLYKLRPVIKILSESFSKCYQPSKHLAIDESMIKFKGRNSMKQYMRDKPIKRGYKVWMLCDKTSYNLKFDIYTGKVGDTVQTGLGEHVVLSLSSELVNKGHYLYFDNYFNSYNLLAGLQQRNIYACGTVQPTRKHLPKLKTDKELSRGEFDWRVSNCGILYLKWKDKRAVHLLSNFHSPEVTTFDMANNEVGATAVDREVKADSLSESNQVVTKTETRSSRVSDSGIGDSTISTEMGSPNAESSPIMETPRRDEYDNKQLKEDITRSVEHINERLSKNIDETNETLRKLAVSSHQRIDELTVWFEENVASSTKRFEKVESDVK